jgi:putative ABC transport system ATP-binding protein
MIKVKNIKRHFKTRDNTVKAVDGVDLTLDEGVLASIIGTSGSGKSTLLALLGALDKPTEGSIEIDGKDVTKMSGRQLTAYRRDKVGFVFQSYNLIPNLSAIQNVMVPMEFAGVKRGERRARAEQLLEQVGLDKEKQNRKPGRLSGGEQQRVAIARALANKPKLILADEPTGNLDTETGKVIVNLLHDLAKTEKATILAVTHDAEIAKQTDETFKIQDGRIVGNNKNHNGKNQTEEAKTDG